MIIFICNSIVSDIFIVQQLDSVISKPILPTLIKVRGTVLGLGGQGCQILL